MGVQFYLATQAGTLDIMDEGAWGRFKALGIEERLAYMSGYMAARKRASALRRGSERQESRNDGLEGY